MCAILQLVSAPSNPRPIVDHFRRSHPLCEHSYWTNWTAHERKTELKTVKWNCEWRHKTKQWLQHVRKIENKKKIKTHTSIIKINNVYARTRVIETLKHNSTSANLIPVGITYTNHKGMHRGLAQFWPSTSVQNQGCSCKFKLYRQLWCR